MTKLKEAMEATDVYLEKRADPKYADLTLVPGEALALVAQAFSSGLDKYPRDDWQRDELDLYWYVSKAIRHSLQWSDGKAADEESGVSPLAHAIADLMIVLWHEQNGHSIHKDRQPELPFNEDQQPL